MDRSAINQALSKFLAYKQCGKTQDASVWLIKLIGELRLSPEEFFALQSYLHEMESRVY